MLRRTRRSGTGSGGTSVAKSSPAQLTRHSILPDSQTGTTEMDLSGMLDGNSRGRLDRLRRFSNLDTRRWVSAQRSRRSASIPRQVTGCGTDLIVGGLLKPGPPSSYRCSRHRREARRRTAGRATPVGGTSSPRASCHSVRSVVSRRAGSGSRRGGDVDYSGCQPPACGELP